MAKTCFVIMPISDTEPYQKGHFKDVYDHLIKPACKKAGFEPIRSDDNLETDFIISGIVEKILNADIAICDLSSKNPNVMYELGIRQAMNKPVTLIKDEITPRVFDISGFRNIEYDHHLSIKTIEFTIEQIAKTLNNDFNNGSNAFNKIFNNSLNVINKTNGENESINISVNKHLDELLSRGRNLLANLSHDFDTSDLDVNHMSKSSLLEICSKIDPHAFVSNVVNSQNQHMKVYELLAITVDNTRYIVDRIFKNIPYLSTTLVGLLNELLDSFFIEHSGLLFKQPNRISGNHDLLPWVDNIYDFLTILNKIEEYKKTNIK